MNNVSKTVKDHQSAKQDSILSTVIVLIISQKQFKYFRKKFKTTKLKAKEFSF